MTKPNIKVNSAPQISREEFAQKSQGGAYIRDAGTYTLKVTAAEWGRTSQYDHAWTSVKLVTQDPAGKEFTFYSEIPTECKNDFLYGDKLSPSKYNEFVKLMGAFGVKIEFERTMQQVGEIFGDLERFVGKQLRLRLGHKKNYVKYLGKNEEGKNQYAFAKPDGELLDGVIFNDFEAANQHAKENNIKFSRYLDILEYVPGSEDQFAADVGEEMDAVIPF
ncbi:MAG: hypothetical protein ACK524_01260 [Planctomyces sp.]|jgi:hypothetical protein